MEINKEQFKLNIEKIFKFDTIGRVVFSNPFKKDYKYKKNSVRE